MIVSEIIIHCTATKEGRAVTTKEVDKWHKAQGWSGIGYHYLVGLDGRVERGRAEWKAGAHCMGHNNRSIGVCYVGGLDESGAPKDTRTPAQKKALRTLVEALKTKYPVAKVYGHRDFANKACPCFDARKEYN